MNVRWTPTDATRPAHAFAAPVVTEVSGGTKEGHSAPAVPDERSAQPLTDCGFATSRFGCGCCDECAAYGDYLQDGVDA